MKSIIRVGVAVISSFLFICHFCTFVSCVLTCDEGCTLDDIQNECICPASVQQGKRSLISSQRTKKSACTHHPTVCKSMGDPHITTFNGTRWITNEVGVFTLLRLDSRSLWIQAKHVSCAIDGHVSCTCGVTAREGNSIIGITKCGEASPLPVGYQLDTKTPPANLYEISGGWKIILISGIEIEVSMWERGQFMHVYVTGLESEVDDYKGLCSKREPRYSRCKEYNCSSLRVKDSESFFNIPQGYRPNCGRYDNPPKCGCYAPLSNNCTDPKSIPVKRKDMRSVCRKPKQKIKNKDNCKEREVVDRGLNLDYRFFDDVESLNRREEFSAEDGRIRCSDALRLTPTYELCSGRVDTSAIVEECAFDENAMKDNGPAKSVPTELETACLDNIRLSLESDASSGASLQELKDLLTRVEKLVCPFQCSQNGKCVDSKCQCNEGFMGTDCSLTIGQAPVIEKILIPVCDVRKDPCTQIQLEASDLTVPENVVCKMRSVNDVDDAVPAVQTSTPVISAGLVVCNLPQVPVSIKESTNGKSATIFQVQVSISNDGQTYSQELPFTVLDGHCMECPASQNTPCQLKENTCSIGGRCYKAEESCPLDAAKICNPAKCTTRWTDESSANCDDGFENCT